MTFEEKKKACVEFMARLAALLSETYTLVGSCNNDCSVYLVPNGTESEVTYYGKPAMSFRFSDHWNWYANAKKCSVQSYIQCHSVDLPRPKLRAGYGLPSKPIFGIQVGVVGTDGDYHAVFGETFDRKRKKWSWLECKPEEVLPNLRIL